MALSENDDMESSFKKNKDQSMETFNENDSSVIGLQTQTTEMPTIKIDDRGSDILPNQIDNSAINTNNESTTDSDKLLGSKRFSKYMYGKCRILVDLQLMGIASQFKDCEILCQGFPSEMKIEKELIPLFEKFGKVYKLKKIMDTNVVFVTYTTTEDFEKAIKSLNRHVFQGRTIYAKENLLEGRLFVKTIPSSATKAEVFQKFSALTYGLVKVSLFNDPANENIHRGFCYLDYENRERAADAKRRLSSTSVFGRTLTIDWPYTHYAGTDKTELKIHNLRSALPQEDLRKMFSVYGELSDVQKIGTLGIVRFHNSEDADRAAREIDKKLLGNENLEISFVRMSKKKIKPLPDSSDTKKIYKQPLPDSSDTTLYINNLYLGLLASDLRKYFSVYGEVSEVDKNDQFAIVRFRNSENAKRAAREIDKQQLGNDVKISFENRTNKEIPKKLPESDTVYINNLRSGILALDLRKNFSVYGEVMEIDKNGNSADVRFRNSEHAKRAYCEIDKQRFGSNVEISLKQKVLGSSDTLYITNLRSEMTSSDMRKYFSVYGQVIEVDKDGKNAFVSFVDIQSAERAMKIDKKRLGNDAEIVFLKTDIPK